jgi:transcriptional regulator with XRE-family HTH domain
MSNQQHPIAAARQQQRLSYRRAASHIGLTARHLERLERGTSIPHPTTATRIARVFPEHFATPKDVRERCREWQRQHIAV